MSGTPSTVKLNLSFYRFGHCKDNALSALDKGIIKADGLHLVAGSLGLNGHYEYGGEAWTDKDFKKRNYRDAHVWIEDNEGRIYDYIDPEWAHCASFWGVRPSFPTSGYTINGKKPEELRKAFNISYIPAEPGTQDKIIKNLGSKTMELTPEQVLALKARGIAVVYA